MNRLLWLAAVLFCARCASAPDESMNSSSVMVDLGDGNGDAIAAYNGFDTSRCGNATAAVLAFKSFNGQRNVTQAGADKLVESSKSKDSDESTATERINDRESGIDEPQSSGDQPQAVVDRRAGESLETALELTEASDIDVDVIEVDGVSTCVVRAPVNLHTPAIARKIAEQGTIKNFYMTGQRSGGGVVEEGAYNNIDTGHVYYDKDGREIKQRNSSKRIDEGAEHNTAISSSFDQEAVAGATGIPAASAPRARNDYICNATNYILSQQGELSYLPGLTFKPLPNPVRTGFVHVSDDSSPEEVARVMRDTMAADRAAADRIAQ